MRWKVLIVMAGLFVGCSVSEEGSLITTPRDGETVKGVVSIVVSPPSTMVVDRVELFVNNTLTATLNGNTSQSYTYEWDTTVLQNGVYTIRVRVFDVDGQMKEQAIQVTIAN